LCGNLNENVTEFYKTTGHSAKMRIQKQRSTFAGSKDKRFYQNKPDLTLNYKESKI
jgi:hypothetical protein